MPHLYQMFGGFSLVFKNDLYWQNDQIYHSYGNMIHFNFQIVCCKLTCHCYGVSNRNDFLLRNSIIFIHVFCRGHSRLIKHLMETQQINKKKEIIYQCMCQVITPITALFFITCCSRLHLYANYIQNADTNRYIALNGNTSLWTFYAHIA